MAKLGEKTKKKICEFWKEGMVCTIYPGQLCERIFAEESYESCTLRNVYGKPFLKRGKDVSG